MLLAWKLGRCPRRQMGLHHAREWPSGEHAIEWAYELVNHYGEDPRTTDLVNRTRTIVVPVVNPDGFNLTRRSGLRASRCRGRTKRGA